MTKSVFETIHAGLLEVLAISKGITVYKHQSVGPSAITGATIIGFDRAVGPDQTAVVLLAPNGRSTIVDESDGVPVCRDIDEDCPEVSDKVACWLYDPCQGKCPWLSSGRKGK